MLLEIVVPQEGRFGFFADSFHLGTLQEFNRNVNQFFFLELLLAGRLGLRYGLFRLAATHSNKIIGR